MAVEKGTEFSAAPERASTSEHDKEQPNGSETRMSVDDVTLDGDENPLNWSKGKKWVSSMIVISMSMTSAFYSGVHASAIDAIAEDYGCSQLASTAGISFFLLGFAAGPLIFAPLSEMFGRNLVIRVSLLIFVITNIGCALAPNIEVLLLFRFLAGFFIAPTVTNAGGSITDVWAPTERSVPWAIFASASYLTVIIGSIIGDFIVEYASWPWIFWVSMILGAVIYIIAILVLPETYAPVLKRRKMLRLNIGIPDEVHLSKSYYLNFTRPWIMLFTEPIVWAMTLYMSFVYGILTLNLVAYPIVYYQIRGWSLGLSSLGYVGIAGGMLVATILSPLLTVVHRRFVAKMGPIPEARLPLQIGLAWLIPISLFWFGWTALPPFHPAVSIVAGSLFGIGALSVFLDVYAYLTDCYGKYSASVMAANGLMLRLFGAAFPLFANKLYEGVGVGWGTSILGFIAVGLAPLPLLFFLYGPILRRRSKYHIEVTAAEGVKSEKS